MKWPILPPQFLVEFSLLRMFPIAFESAEFHLLTSYSLYDIIAFRRVHDGVLQYKST